MCDTTDDGYFHLSLFKCGRQLYLGNNAQSTALFVWSFNELLLDAWHLSSRFTKVGGSFSDRFLEVWSLSLKGVLHL